MRPESARPTRPFNPTATDDVLAATLGAVPTAPSQPRPATAAATRTTSPPVAADDQNARYNDLIEQLMKTEQALKESQQRERHATASLESVEQSLKSSQVEARRLVQVAKEAEVSRRDAVAKSAAAESEVTSLKSDLDHLQLKTGGWAPSALATSLRNEVQTAAAHQKEPLRPPNPGCGHVFVLNCSIIGIAADAILIPLRDVTNVTIPTGSVGLLTRRESDAAGHSAVSMVYEGQITTRLYTTEKEAIQGTMTVVTRYMQEACAALKGTKSALKRAKPLVALPMPGVGRMDENDLIVEMGDICRPLLDAMYAAASKYEVDIAVCTVDEGAFDVAQVLRDECCPFEGGPFWMLSAELRAEAARLREQALAGRLGLLFGAGVSFPSGLPSWGGLLQQLAERAGYDERSQKALAELGFLDQPTLIEEKMGGATKFKQAVADCVQHGRYTPAHSIMGSMALPAVTTNCACVGPHTRDDAQRMMRPTNPTRTSVSGHATSSMPRASLS